MTAPTPAFTEICDTFAFLEEWEDRYRHVIEMGKDFPPMDEALKVPATKVEGCASQVWLHPDFEGGGLRFSGDSDAIIVRGLIAVLHALYAGLSPKEVLAVDAPAALAELGLVEHLSAQRSNGVRAMTERLRGSATAAL